MKKRPVLHQFAVFGIAASIFFSVTSFAQANTFTLPQQFQYPGLIFSAPLTFSHPPSIPQPTTSFSFTSQKKLTLIKNTQKKTLGSLILSPTIGETTNTMTVASIPQPTPTIYVQTQVTLTPTPIIEETVSPSPLPTDQPTTTPSPTYSPAPQSNPGGLNAADIFNMVNTYRASQGLPAFQQDAKSCSLAAVRAPEVAGEVASGNYHAGLIAMNLPYWNTENIISMNSDQAAFNWWINDPIHHAAIVSSNIYSCVACSGNSCAEEFTSYQPR